MKGAWSGESGSEQHSGWHEMTIWRAEVIFLSAAEGSERCQLRQRWKDVCALKRMSREQDKGKLRPWEREDEAGMRSELNRPAVSRGKCGEGVSTEDGPGSLWSKGRNSRTHRWS